MYVTSGHVYCQFGRSLKYKNIDLVIEEHVQRFTKQKLKLLATTAPPILK